MDNANRLKLEILEHEGRLIAAQHAVVEQVKYLRDRIDRVSFIQKELLELYTEQRQC